jgi:hypothetical protein
VAGVGSIPLRATVALRDSLGLTRAVETGTFEGDGAYELSRVFASVVTIELSPELHNTAKARLAKTRNVALVLGDSREKLAELVQADVPTLYFLDGHWSDGFTSGADNQCPVLDELRALAGGHPRDCIVIDDAGFFLSAPPPPYDPASWPSLMDLLGALQAARPSHHIAIVKDQVYAVPTEGRPVVDALGQRSHQHSIRRRVRLALGDRLAPWSPARRALKRMRRRISLGIEGLTGASGTEITRR